jgi:hypothetical protein
VVFTNTVEAPTHRLVVPVVVEGAAFTVRFLLALHPVGSVYEIVVMPMATPLITPVEEPTVATAVLLLLHVPPDDAEVSVVVLPTHVTAVPVIDAGKGSTVTTVVVEHPGESV